MFLLNNEGGKLLNRKILISLPYAIDIISLVMKISSKTA